MSASAFDRGGVIEGFYGRPWTHAQRLDMIRRTAVLVVEHLQGDRYPVARRGRRQHRIVGPEARDRPLLGRQRRDGLVDLETFPIEDGLFGLAVFGRRRQRASL